MKEELSNIDSKIRESLKILNYDSNKHKNLRNCFTELLKRDDINKAVSGIITDSKVLEEVSKIIDAYEFLKEHEDEMLYVLDLVEKEKIVVPKVIDEILIYYDDEDNCYRVMKKQQDTSQYMVILETDDIIVYENYYLAHIDDKYALCNFRGEVLRFINDNEQVKSVTDKIIKICENGNYETDNDIYYMLEKDGNDNFKNLVNLNKVTSRILSSKDVSDENKNYIFNLVWSGKKIDYGKNVISIHVNGNYTLATYEDGSSCYFTLDGHNKIISTDDDKYFYIGNLLSKNNGKTNIIVVGYYDENLNKCYSYYDLDKRKLCFNKNFPKLFTWTDFGGIVFAPNLSIIKENGELLDCSKNEDFPITKNPFMSTKHFCEKIIAVSAKKWKNDVYIVKFVADDLQRWPNHPFDNVADDNFKAYFRCKNGAYALVSNIYTNPKRISAYFLNYKMINNESDIIFVDMDYSSGFRILDINGNLKDIIRLDDNNQNKKCISTVENKINAIETILNKSAFLLPNYESGIDYNKLISTSQERLNNSELMIITEDDHSYMVPCEIKNNIRVDNVDSFENLEDVKVDSIKQVSNNGTFIAEAHSYSKHEDFSLAINIDGKPIFYRKATPVSIDCVDNIVMEVPYSDSARKILVNNNGKILIDFSHGIIPNNEGLYIVNRKDKYQLYDSLGIPASVPTDRQEWVKKYSVDENGVVHNTTTKLLITNAGYKYLVDDDGDITLKENKHYAKILQKVNLLSEN